MSRPLHTHTATCQTQRLSDEGGKTERLALVDGSQLEGGGQILRNAAALACITGVPVRVHSVRSGRDSPGLRPQHLTGLQLVAALCKGTLEGGVVGSSDVKLTPGALLAVRLPRPLEFCNCMLTASMSVFQGEHTADTRTAGSITLLAQTALPCMLFATGDGPCTLHLKGGTDTKMAPPVDYLLHVLLPTLRTSLGLHVTASLKRRGFYPKGGGELTLAATPVGQAGVPPLNLVHRGKVKEVRATVFVAGTIPPAVGQRMVDAAKAALLAAEVADVSAGCVSVHLVQETRDSALGDGCGITLVAETDTGCLLGASALGERGKRAEDVGREAAVELAAAVKSGACVDGHLADQLVIFMALAGHGTARMLAPAPLSLHCRTAIAVAGQMTTAKFTVLEAGERSADDGTEAVPPGTCLVICQGHAGMRAHDST